MLICMWKNNKNWNNDATNDIYLRFFLNRGMVLVLLNTLLGHEETYNWLLPVMFCVLCDLLHGMNLISCLIMLFQFAVLYDARANTGIDRMKIIGTVAKSVTGPHKVDLNNPDIHIVVQICKVRKCFSILLVYNTASFVFELMFPCIKILHTSNNHYWWIFKNCVPATKAPHLATPGLKDWVAIPARFGSYLFPINVGNTRRYGC